MSTSTLELWQTEWCPASHRVRQRLTEFGLTYTTRQVPVNKQARTELRAATGATEIPVLLTDGGMLMGEREIVTYLNQRFTEPPEATEHRARAAKAKLKELESACPELASVSLRNQRA